MDPIKTFICYAHEDRKVVGDVLKHLRQLQKQRVLEIWDDGQILAGQDWDATISQKLRAAQLVLLFVSIDFLDSEYIEKKELKTALERHREGEAVLVSIIVRQCGWQDYTELSQLQALPAQGRPIQSRHYPHADEAYDEIAAGVRKTALDLLEKAKAAALVSQQAAEQAEQQHLAQVKDTAAWTATLKAAEEADSADEAVAALRTYIRQHPSGKHLEEAREKINMIYAAEAARDAKVKANAARERAKAFKQKHDSAHTFEKGGLLTEAVALLRELLPLHEEGFVSSPAELEVRIKALELRLGPPPPADFVLVKGGTFEMGDVMGDNEYNNEQVHTVTVDDFYLAKYALTFDEYDAFCAATQREKPDDRKWGRGQRPVINVSWFDAVAYCNWRSQQEKRSEAYLIQNETVTLDSGATGYRLPTEAEWEYAAREGGKKVRFGNGRNEIKPSEINFNSSKTYKKPYSEVGTYRERTVPVGELSANALGLYQMLGNVWDWCWDWYAGDYYVQSNGAPKPLGPAEGAARVLRGGSWLDSPQVCRATFRIFNSPTYRNFHVGLRPALPFTGR